MNIRAKLATVAGKSTKFILEKTRGGGSSLPGKVAMKLDPAVLAELSKDYRVVMITGTNGKTLTTSFITKIFQAKFGNYHLILLFDNLKARNMWDLPSVLYFG